MEITELLSAFLVSKIPYLESGQCGWNILLQDFDICINISRTDPLQYFFLNLRSPVYFQFFLGSCNGSIENIMRNELIHLICDDDFY